MRDPTRIDRILKLMGEVWAKNPDLRLGQLMINLTHHDADWPSGHFDLHGFEDDRLEQCLRMELVELDLDHERISPSPRAEEELTDYAPVTLEPMRG